MNVPVFVKSLAFWKAVAYVVAVVWFYFDPASVVTEATILGLVLAFLNFVNVKPELRAKGLM